MYASRRPSPPLAHTGHRDCAMGAPDLGLRELVFP